MLHFHVPDALELLKNPPLPARSVQKEGAERSAAATQKSTETTAFHVPGALALL